MKKRKSMTIFFPVLPEKLDSLTLEFNTYDGDFELKSEKVSIYDKFIDGMMCPNKTLDFPYFKGKNKSRSIRIEKTISPFLKIDENVIITKIRNKALKKFNKDNVITLCSTLKGDIDKIDIYHMVENADVIIPDNWVSLNPAWTCFSPIEHHRSGLITIDYMWKKGLLPKDRDWDCLEGELANGDRYPLSAVKTKIRRI